MERGEGSGVPCHSSLTPLRFLWGWSTRSFFDDDVKGQDSVEVLVRVGLRVL